MRFFSVTKPGIIFGNMVSVCGGFFLASAHSFNFLLLLHTVFGMALVIASACVFNNVIDQDIDALMARTQRRALVVGLISEKTAVVYGILLGLLGFLALGFFTNWLSTLIAFVGYFFYVVVYSLYFKRQSALSTLLGGVAGAVPPVVGYSAVTHQLDLAAVLLFLILLFWQMPHFYAISIYRLEDFSKASLPILPLRQSVRFTKISALVYTALFLIAALMPAIFHYSGIFYGAVALLLGGSWLCIGIFYFNRTEIWARKMFLFSIINITLLCVAMGVDHL